MHELHLFLIQQNGVLLFHPEAAGTNSDVLCKTLAVEPGFTAVDVAYIKEVLIRFVF